MVDTPQSTVPRPLTPGEEAVLVALITRGDPLSHSGVVTDNDRARWLAHVPRTRAGHRCGCGTCPSLTLLTPENATPPADGRRVLLEATTASALLLLVVADDHPNYLELTPLHDNVAHIQFPDPHDIDYPR